LQQLTLPSVKPCNLYKDNSLNPDFQIILFELDSLLDESSVMVFSLKKIVDWNHNYLVSSLGSFGNRIVAGDQISSVSLLKVTGTSLVSQAKDYGPLYPVSVEALDPDNIICANVSVI
jgi:DNA damage-binding protein 1